MKRKTMLSWSSGKDSALALYELSKSPDFEVIELLTVVNETHERVAMHAVRRDLLERQAKAARLPLYTVEIPSPCSNEVYEAKMKIAVETAIARGIECIAFGDLFLEDIRRYREDRLAKTPLSPIFPLWGRDTRGLAEAMIDLGIEAYLTCIDPRKLPAEFVGRRFDRALLADLPDGVDPCGENGEFHSFVSSGPMFREAIDIEIGERVERDGFVFADVVPKSRMTP